MSDAADAAKTASPAGDLPGAGALSPGGVGGGEVRTRLTAALAGRYRVEREAGAGGMATVYLAHDERHDRAVAIKVLREELGMALGAERFLAEIRTTAKLQHPHILPLLDSGAADGLLYYVMPYVRGETLRTRLRRETQLPIPDAVRLATEVAAALDHAHAQGVIHRDIKPENILLQDGSALVADFGIALAVQEAGGARMTQTGLSLGTPQYMSPEQALGERVIDARSDVYALAAVSYEMLTGEPPFTGPTVAAIVAKVTGAEPEPPSLLRKTIPAGVERAVLTALAKLPADRFATAGAFATALRDSGATGGARPPAVAWHERRGQRAMRALLLTGTAVLTFVAGWVARPLASRAGAAARADALTRVQATFTGVVSAPALTATGDVLAYAESQCAPDRPQSCRMDLLVQDTGSSTPVRILRGAARIASLRWAPSGTTLLAGLVLDSVARGIYVIPRLGGTARRVAPLGAFDLHPLGDTLVVVPNDRLATGGARWAQLVAVATGQAVDSLRLPSGFFGDLAWSPDGRLIAVTTASTMYVVNRRTAQLDSMTGHFRGTVRWTPAGDALLVFSIAAGKDDDFVRIGVSGSGRIVGPPVPIAPRGPTLLRGEFDVARQSGLVALVTGQWTADFHVFPLAPGGGAATRQVTRGTTWYGPPMLSPDGRTLYYARGTGAGDNLFRLKLDGDTAGEVALTTGTGSSTQGYGMTADGSHVAFERADDTLIATIDVDTRTGAVTTVRRRMDGSFLLDGAPGGQSVLLSAGFRTLVIRDSASAPPRQLDLEKSIVGFSARLSPDGRQLAVGPVSGDGAGSMLVITPVERWAPRVVYRGLPRQLGPLVEWRTDGHLYFLALDARERAVLQRIAATGTPDQVAERVMDFPARCLTRLLGIPVLARDAPVGACQVVDARGDVYLWRLDGVSK